MTIKVTSDIISLPRRDQYTHKGDYGRCLIIAGSTCYTGAPSFASRAAVRSGAGLVYLGVPEPAHAVTAIKNDEAVVFPLDSENGMLSKFALAKILRRLASCDVCLIGPGLGRSKAVDSAVYGVIRASNVPLVIDADGINAVAANINVLCDAKCPVILTPHEGEFLRLGGEITASGREAAARDFAERHGCIMVLKGHDTVTAFPDGRVFLNTTGNAGMAKGGSGDVLAGIIAALIGQKLPLEKAVPTAVWLHGRAGDIAAEKYGEYSMTPSDIIELLPEAIKPVVR